jgi:hypothetical protein
MKKLVKDKNLKLINLVHNIILQEDENNTVEINPELYKKLLIGLNGNAQYINNLPQYRGKQIVINGTLDLSDHKFKDKITDLGNITINGRVDLSNTGIRTIKGINTNGRIIFYRTPYEKYLESIKKQKERAEAQERREDDDWDLRNTDTIGEMAHAVFEFMKSHDKNVKSLNDEEEEKLYQLKERLKNLNKKLKSETNSEKREEIEELFNETEENIEELMYEVHDVYDLIEDGTHYYLTQFKSINDETYGQSYAVGTEKGFDRALEYYFEELVDTPEHYFDSNFLEDFINGDEVASYFEDGIRDDVYESPESFDVQKTLSKSQEDEIWILNMEKWVYENEGIRFPIKYPTKEENGSVFDFWDENEEHEFKLRYEKNSWVLYKDGIRVQPGQLYDDSDTQDHQDDRESRVSDIEYEIQEIEENPDGDLDEDSVEEAVDYKLDHIRNNPVYYLREYGYDIERFLDKDRLLTNLVDDGEYGQLSSYSDEYDYFTINDTRYYVIRTN